MNVNEGQKKNTRKSSRNAFVISIAVVLAAAVLLNAVVHVLTDRFNLRADLSQEKYYTISAQTAGVLDGLQEDIYIYTLYTADNVDERVQELLKSYAAASPRVHVENIDPTYSPTFTQQFDPDGNGISSGSVILTNAAEDNYSVLTVYDLYVVDTVYMLLYGMQAEQKMTSTINYLQTGERPAVKVLGGHDESTLSELGSLTAALRGLGYSVEGCDLAVTQEDLDAEYDILLAVSPKGDLTAAEYDRLKAFLDAGGNAAFLMDRIILDETSGTNYVIGDELQNFNSILMLYDIKLNNDYIIGGNSDKILGKPTAHIPDMYEHETITVDIIAAGKSPVLTDVSSLTLSGDGEYSAVLMRTDADTWAKELSGGSVTIDKEDGDAEGPFTVAALGQRGESCIAVYGTSSFTTQTEMERSANYDLIVNTINSLKKKGDSINIPAKSLVPGIMELRNDTQKNILTALVMVILPAAIFIFGFAVWRKRKSL
jgi:ABC-type uncharacterized transport system involved in gliding motility auxiliary subunit